MEICSEPPSPIESLIRQLELETDKPPGNDPRIAAFARVALRRVREDHKWSSIVHDFLTERPDLSPSYRSNLFLRAVQADQIANNQNYPKAHENTEVWEHTFDDIGQDFERLGQIVVNLHGSNTMSNIAERYKAIKMVLLMMGHRFDDVSILDIGCSLNHGLKQLVLNKGGSFSRYKFGKVEVSIGPDIGEDPSLQIPSLGYTAMFNRLMNRKRANIGPSLGVDIMNSEDPVIQEWAISCSFYPSELLDTRRVRNARRLEKKQPKQVGFYREDFTDLDHKRFREKSPVSSYDVVVLSTILYQLNPEERAAMIANAKKYTSPDGLIIIQDFASLKTDPISSMRTLEFDDHWYAHPYKYRTYVIDMQDPDEQLQEIFLWENGRCDRVALGTGRIAVKNAFVPVAEAFDYALRAA